MACPMRIDGVGTASAPPRTACAAIMQLSVIPTSTSPSAAASLPVLAAGWMDSPCQRLSPRNEKRLVELSRLFFFSSHRPQITCETQRAISLHLNVLQVCGE